MNFDNLRVTDDAKLAQIETVKYLESLGYACEMEFPVKDRGDGRTGKIDIVAWNDRHSIAIEFDNKSPRRKSIYKLLKSNFDYKAILLRGTDRQYIINGIHIIPIKIK